MTRTITAHEATVKTATVDVKALTISGRQVTLSVFRQLKDEPLVDEDTGQLRGVPWGIVNYFWGDCAKTNTHLHVVWQVGDQLRRACCWPKPNMEPNYHTESWHGPTAKGWTSRKNRTHWLVRAYLLAAAARDVESNGDRLIDVEVPTSAKYHTIRIAFGGRQIESHLDTDDVLDVAFRKACNWERKPFDGRSREWDCQLGGYKPWPPEEHERLKRAHDETVIAEERAIVDALKAGARRIARIDDPFGIVAMATDAEQEWSRFEKEWADTYATLADLDHLFIAV